MHLLTVDHQTAGGLVGQLMPTPEIWILTFSFLGHNWHLKCLDF